MSRNKTNNKTPNTNPPNNTPTSSSEYIDNPNKDYKIIYASKETMDDVEDVNIITAESIQTKSEQWMYQALEHFDNGGKQYSVTFNEGTSSTQSSTTIDDIKNLALNAQNDLSKILKINALIRQASNEDDIIGKVHESVEANLNSNVRISFDEIPEDLIKECDNIIISYEIIS